MKVKVGRTVGIVLVLASLCALATFLYVQHIARLPVDNTYIPNKTPIGPEIALLRDYVRIDTSNPPGLEMAGARFLMRYLQDNGVTSELIESAPGRANVYARIRGKSDRNGLLLLHHIDVVPAKPEEWKYPPFLGKVWGNQLWGRGTLDMKGIGICELVAFVRIARMHQMPEHDLVLLATSDEEEGSTFGMAWLVDHRPDIFQRIGYAVNEGGITETLGDKITYVGVEVGSKLACRATLLSRDRVALEKARIRLEPLQTPEDPERVLPEVAYFLTRIAPHRRQNTEYLVDVRKTIERGDFWRLHHAFRALTQNNVWVEKIRQVDDHFEASVILENLFDQDPDGRFGQLRQLLPAGVELRVVSDQRPVPLTPWDTPFSRLLERTMKTVYGPTVSVGPQLLQYSSNDSRFLRRLGIRAYGWWPFPVTLYQTGGIHGRDESIRLDWYMEGIQATKLLVDDFCRNPGAP